MLPNSGGYPFVDLQKMSVAISSPTCTSRPSTAMVDLISLLSAHKSAWRSLNPWPTSTHFTALMGSSFSDLYIVMVDAWDSLAMIKVGQNITRQPVQFHPSKSNPSAERGSASFGDLEKLAHLSSFAAFRCLFICAWTSASALISSPTSSLPFQAMTLLAL